MKNKVFRIASVVLFLAVPSCIKPVLVIDVSKVTVAPATLVLTEGESSQLSAMVEPSNATEKVVTWNSTSPDVVSVDANGKVSALKIGSASVTATAGGKKGTCVISVEAKTIPVSSITLNKSSLALTEGESETLVATVKPDNATDRTVVWSSSNEMIATVDQSGKITAVKEGSSSITAKSGNMTATCEVIVSKRIIPVTSIWLDKNRIELSEGESETLVATVNPSDATEKGVTWSSSDASVATVEDGVVLAIAPGVTTIQAKAGDCSAICEVNVVTDGARLVDLGLSVMWADRNIGAERPEAFGYYYAWGEVETKEEFSWTTYKWHNIDVYESLTKYNYSSAYGPIDNRMSLEPEDDVAHVVLGDKWRMPSKQEAQELIEGCSWIWTSLNGINGYRVVSKINGNSIFLPEAGSFLDHLFLGGSGNYWTITLSETVGNRKMPDCANTLYFYDRTWYIGSGQNRYQGCPVRAVYGDRVRVSGITLDVPEIIFEKVGEIRQLYGTIIPDNAAEKGIVWSSSNEASVTVDNDYIWEGGAIVKDLGRVTAVAPGTAIITASSVDGSYTATCKVTVK